MNELSLMLKALARQSYRLTTFRGSWTDMPESTGLCVTLGIASYVCITLALYALVGIEMAAAIPVVWLSAAWLFSTENGAWHINKKMLSALFLITTPIGLLAILLGGHSETIGIALGVYAVAVVLSLKGK